MTLRKPEVINCIDCQLEWCFDCHAPWHQGLTCQKYKKGDKMLEKWAKLKSIRFYQRNAQRCPKCKVPLISHCLNFNFIPWSKVIFCKKKKKHLLGQDKTLQFMFYR